MFAVDDLMEIVKLIEECERIKKMISVNLVACHLRDSYNRDQNSQLRNSNLRCEDCAQSNIHFLRVSQLPIETRKKKENKSNEFTTDF